MIDIRQKQIHTYCNVEANKTLRKYRRRIDNRKRQIQINI